MGDSSTSARTEVWIRRGASLLVAVCLPIVWFVGTAPDAQPYAADDATLPRRVLVAGREERFLALVAGDGPLRFSNVRIQPARIEAYIEPEGRLLLRDAGSVETPLVRTRSFDVVFEGPVERMPEARRHAEGIARRDRGDIWSERSDPSEDLDRWSYFARHAEALGFTVSPIVPLTCLLGLAWLVALVGARGAPGHAPSAAPSGPWLEWPFALVPLHSAVALTIVLSTFHFFLDDYGFLTQTELGPWSPDPHLRWLAATARFSLLRSLGSPEWAFALTNLVALVATSGLLALLLLRAGASKSASLLAAALFSMGPGAYQMVRWASGFEHLSAAFFVLLVVLLADVAFRNERRTRRRVGVLALLTVVAAMGAFTKGKVLVVGPPAAFLWVVTRVKGARLRDGLLAGACAAVGIALPPYFLIETFLLTEHLYPVGDQLPRFLHRVFAELGLALVGPLFGLTLLTGYAARRGLHPALATRHALRVLAETLLLAAVLAAPFVLQGEKFPSYYAFLPFAPLAALVATATVRTASVSEAPRWLLVIVLLAWAPVHGVVRNLRAPHSYDHDDDGVWAELDADAWLDGVVEATAPFLEPENVFVTACDRRSQDDVIEYERLVSGPGVRYRTRWLHAAVLYDLGESTPRPAEGAVVVEHCRGRPPRAWVANSHPAADGGR